MPPARETDINIPIPDPTVLTTQQLVREVESVKALLMAWIAKLEEVTKTRLDGMDKAIELVRDSSDKIPMSVDEKIASLRSIHDTMFQSIQTQFHERDVRTEKSEKDTKTAVDAALQAAEKAVGKQQEASDKAIAKSETNMSKLVEQLGVLVETVRKTSDDKVGDLKERITVLESEKRGAAGQVIVKQAETNTTSLGTLAAIAASMVAAAGGAAGITALLMRH